MQPAKRTTLRGRPPKFKEPRRPITVTLPVRTLELLSRLHHDRAKALASAVDSACGQTRIKPPVEVVAASDGLGVIIVGPSKALLRVPSLTLVEVSPDRYLLALPLGSSTDTLEVGLIDVLEDLNPAEESERPLLEELRSQIARLRRSRRVQRAEILFVQL